MVIQLAFLLAFITGQVTAGTYVLTSPKVCRVGIACNAQLRLMGQLGTETTAVVTILSNTKTTVVSRSMRLDATTTQATFSLMVPMGTEEKKDYNMTFSLQGKDISYSSHSKLEIKTRIKASFIITDKAIYKPKQTVRFRVLCVKPDSPKLTPCKADCKMDVNIYDPQSNKIKHWLQQSHQMGVFSEKLQLADRVLLGDWKILVKLCDGSEVEKIFTVDEYVLPKFEVTVQMPPFYVISSNENMQFKIIANYTYGKGVVGSGQFSVSIKGEMDHKSKPLMRKFENFNGVQEVTLTVGDMRAILGGQILADHTLVVKALITEQLTELKKSGEGSVQMFALEHKAEILTADVFKPNAVLNFMVKLTKADGTPTTTKWSSCSLSYMDRYPGTQIGTFKPGELNETSDGMIMYSISTKDITFQVTLKAVLRLENNELVKTEKIVKPFLSHSGDNLQAQIDTIGPIKCGGQAHFTIKSSKKASLQYYYTVICRGIIQDLSGASGILNSDGVGKITVTTTSSMYPSCRLLAYLILPSENELIADNVDFDVQCDNNPVSVEFRKSKEDVSTLTEVQPTGDEIVACARAKPGSFIGMMSIDKSVLLLKGGNDITKQQVKKLMGLFDSSDAKDNSDDCPSCDMRDFFIPWGPQGIDTAEVLKQTGVLVMTNARIYQSRPVGPWPEVVFMNNADRANVKTLGKSNTAGNSVQEGYTRKFFPEAWLWADIDGSTGEYCFPAKVPDTITSWITTAFAMSESDGLGVMAKPTKLVVYRPFFVSLTLLPFIKRGEEFVLKVIVFNYKPLAVKTEVTLHQSEDFFVRHQEGNKDIEDVAPVSKDVLTVVNAAPSQGTLAQFLIVPQKIGTIKIKVSARAADGSTDAVLRELLVKPEGEERCSTQSFLADLTTPQQNSETQTFDTDFPMEAVSGSQSIMIKTTGDLMGPTIQGLDQLLTIPVGCGEQNMLTMVPNIFVLDYLNAINNLDSSIRARGLTNMETGYQRELLYRHEDGSFSAFGTSDPSGSTWLTAFVVKSFSRAHMFIYIDDKILSKAVKWLLTQQTSDGSFMEPGRVIHSEMQGGSASNNLSLTAFVLIGLVESKAANVTVDMDLAVQKAVSYLQSKIDMLSDVYAVSLVTYALHLANVAGGQDQRNQAFTKLSNMATREGGVIYWDIADVIKPKTNRYRHQAKSSSVETTAYGLMTYILRDESDVVRIGKWMTKQSNGRGGFVSTQDTVIGLQAISELARHLTSSGTSLQITFSYRDKDGGEITQLKPDVFNLNANNKLLLQSKQAPTQAAKVMATASGNGLAIVSVMKCWNEETTESTAIDSKVTVKDDNDNSYTLNVCVKSQISTGTGMAISEIEPVTGFSPDSEKLKNMKKIDLVKRIEENNGKVVVYYDEISNTTQTCLDAPFIRTSIVSKPVAASVMVKVYYNPNLAATGFYLPGKAKDARLCQLCPDCPNCDGVVVPTKQTSATAATSFSLVAMVTVLIVSLVALIV